MGIFRVGMTENERIAGANNSQTLDKGWGRILLFLLPTQIKDGVVSYFSGRLCRPKSKKQKGVSLGATPPMGETLVSLLLGFPTDDRIFRHSIPENTCAVET